MATDRLKKKIGVGRHLSAIKRARQTIKRNERNKDARSAMRTAIKNVRTTASKEDLAKAAPMIAKAAGKGLIHRRKAARLISRLTKAVNAAQA